MKMKFLTGLLTLLALWAPLTSANPNAEKINVLLTQAEKPYGVVFEIVKADPKALRWAIPEIRGYIKKLRSKYPDIEVAVVSHGREQFALQTEKAEQYRKVHESVKKLANQDDVPVHICQTFASWNNVEAEDFPDYVKVSTTGPQQIRDYQDLGYTLIKIR